MHAERLLIAARVVAWTIALGAVVAVVIGYESLPEMIPLTRWTEVAKSPLLALRVPVINLLTLGLIEVLARGLRRVSRFEKTGAVVTVLLLTAAAKAAVEAVALLKLPGSSDWSALPLGVILIVGLGMAAFLGRDLLQRREWQQLQLTRTETAVTIALVAGIVALNLPLLAR